MIEELASMLDAFPGPEHQTRCFTHILNLVVKTIIKQFDLPKARAGQILDKATAELLKLAGDIETEEKIALTNGEDGEEGEDDNVEGWIDERETMDVAELEELEASVQPVRLLLTKVTCSKTAAPPQTKTYYIIDLTAAQNGICCEELFDPHTSQVVLSSRGPSA
jgi:hypothetical protein